MVGTIALGGGGTPHMKGVGMLVGNLNLTPKGDQSGRGPTFFWPLKAIISNLDYINRVNKTNWKYTIVFCPENPKEDQNPKFTPLSETTSIPAPFIYGVPPGNHCFHRNFRFSHKCPINWRETAVDPTSVSGRMSSPTWSAGIPWTGTVLLRYNRKTSTESFSEILLIVSEFPGLSKIIFEV